LGLVLLCSCAALAILMLLDRRRPRTVVVAAA
jgi:hypothetical protein